VEDAYVRGTRVETPPGMLTRDVAWFVDRASIVWGPTEVGAVAPATTVLTLGEQLAIFYIVVVSAAPRAKEGVVTGMVGPGVVEEVAGVADLIVCQVLEGRRAVNDARGDAVVGVGIGQGFGTLKALLGDVSQVLM
jgi:hypothetical protein